MVALARASRSDATCGSRSERLRSFWTDSTPAIAEMLSIDTLPPLSSRIIESAVARLPRTAKIFTLTESVSTDLPISFARVKSLPMRDTRAALPTDVLSANFFRRVSSIEEAATLLRFTIKSTLSTRPSVAGWDLRASIASSTSFSAAVTSSAEGAISTAI